MKKFVFMTLCAAVLGFAGVAQAVTYDFNSLTLGYYTDAEFNAFFSDVTFDNTADAGNDGWLIQDSTSSLGNLQADFSGYVVLNIPYYPVGNSTVAVLGSNTDFVSVTMGDYDQDADTLYLYAYDAGNNLVGFDTYDNPADSFAGYTLSVSSAAGDIAWVEFYGVGYNDENNVYWDNFTFNVPEPSSILLLGTGLLGLVGIRRRFQD